MNNSEKYKIFISNKTKRFVDNLASHIKKKFMQQLDRRIRTTPNIPDKIHIQHIMYDLFELKIDNIRFYYFVYNRDVKIVDFFAEGVFNPFVEFMLSSTKDRQKDTLTHLRKNYNSYYNKPIGKKKYSEI